MSSEMVSFRWEPGLGKRVRALADVENLDRSSVIREALEIGVREKQLANALAQYKTRKITAWKAAGLAEVSLWEFLDELKRRGEFFETSEDDLREMVRSL